LVTDLFKVYKTRIWMSAINPASFASPSLGLQAPSGIGPGAVGVTRPAQAERRPQQQEPSGYASLTQGSRAYQGGPMGPFASGPDRSHVLPATFQQPSYAYGYSTFAAAPRTNPVSIGSYAPNMLQQIDQFSPFGASTDFQQMPARFPSPHSVGLTHDSSDYARRSNGHPGGSDAWMTSFQGLSLNSR